MRVFLGLLLITPLLTGCYIKGSIDDLDSITKLFQSSPGTELNSGAAPLVTTSGGYQVGHALGNLNGTMTAKTSGGYQVFMTVQGSVYSEAVEAQPQ